MRIKNVKKTELNETIVQIYKEERLKVLQEKWDNLSSDDKKFVVEFLIITQPEKSKLIKEDKWYNTLGDIVGIFDPTGIVDVVNGVSYWRQGDKLFAILSWISAIPYLGDLIAKPVIGVMKAGGVVAKGFKSAVLAADAAKMAKYGKSAGGPLAKLLRTSPEWGDKLMTALEKSIGKIPGIGSNFIKTVKEYVELFKKGSSQMSKMGSTSTKAGEGLSKSEKLNIFRTYKGVGGSMFSASNLAGGIGRVWGNRATRSLMRRTKWYLGLLDSLGITNFVGPDELETIVPDLDKKVEEYNKTDDAKTKWSEDFGNMKQTEPKPTEPQDKSQETKLKINPIDILISSMFGGGKLI